jgi:Dolichyl-phosphate-mannose-protein mannosyltransferase
VDQSSTKEKSRQHQFLLVGLTIAVLAPFLNKAFHVDDPLFIWMAQQIAKNPLDPYGFFVNWSTSVEPMWKVMQNPPLCSYYIAAIGSLGGWNEVGLHLAFLIWPILAVLGTYAVARRFCREPFLAALLTLFTPVFLISATNVMCDLMLLALWLWSIESWIEGLERKSWVLLIVSTILAVAAAFTKYFGISLVPLLIAYTLARDRRLSIFALPLLLPVGAMIAFELTTQSHYGIGLFADAVALSRKMAGFKPPWSDHFLTGLAFTGGCCSTMIFFQRRSTWRFWLSTCIAVILFLLLWYFVPLHPAWAITDNSLLVRLEGGIFSALGAAVLTLALTELFRRKDPASFLLCLWILGTFSFATFCNWSITGRTILPMVPAAAISLLRWREDSFRTSSLALRYVGILVAATLSLVLATVDYRQAGSARDASNEFQHRFKANRGTVWFESHWGFQYYMQQWGAMPLDVAASDVHSNDILVFPSNNTSIAPVPMEKLFGFETMEFGLWPLFSTLGRGTGAAFYSSARGPIPWAIDRVGPEIYYVTRFR